ncbi:MAG: cytochrome c biogenesis CcdA family protein [Gaiellaceae bacterium]
MSAKLLTAFLAGAISFLSPCVLPLVPSYLAAISTPHSRCDRRGKSSRSALKGAATFVLGFTGVFVLLGAGAGLLAREMPFDATGMRCVAGLILVVLGLALGGLLPWELGLAAPGLLQSVRRRGSAILLGAAFATCAAPCIGPVLGATLIVGGSSRAVGPAATTLLAYSLGLALPFAATSIAFTHVFGAFRRLRNSLEAARTISGLILVGTGALLFFGRIWWLNTATHHLQSTIGF